METLIFCGTLTTGGLEETVGPDGLVIEREGRIRRFVDGVEQITFNAWRGLDAGKHVTVVTDRGIFAVTAEGLVLTDIVPGVDLARDILGQIPFAVRVAGDLRRVPAELLVPAGAPAAAATA